MLLSILAVRAHTSPPAHRGAPHSHGSAYIWFSVFVVVAVSCVALTALELILARNSALPCFCLPSAGVEGVCHYVQLQSLFLGDCRSDWGYREYQHNFD